jgi:hypothetical protein
MPAEDRFLRRRDRRLVPAFVAAVVLGILGMHALAQHCPTPSTSIPAMASTAGAGAEHAGHHLAAAPLTVMTVMEAEGLGDRLSAPAGGPGGDLLMLCAAIVLGTGAALALLLRRRRSWTAGAPALARRLWRAPVALAGAGPPPLLAFVVVRC